MNGCLFVSKGCVLSLKAEVNIESASMIKYYQGCSCAYSWFDNNYHLLVMCRADIADEVEVYLHDPLSLSHLHSRKSRSRHLKESIFRENQSCIDRKQSQTKGKQHLDVFILFH